MRKQRSYQQACNIAYALDVIGERWTLLLIRDLLLGPKRFGELQASLEGIGANLLSTRLKELERQGILEKVSPDDGSKRQRYSLSEQGLELEPILAGLIRWGAKLPVTERSAEDRYVDEWDRVALRLLFDGRVDPSLRGRVDLRSESGTLEVSVVEEGLVFGLEDSGEADLVLRAKRSVLVALFQGNSDWLSSEGSGVLEVEGDRDFAARWFACFGQ